MSTLLRKKNIKRLWIVLCEKNQMQHTHGCVEDEHAAFVIEKIFKYNYIQSDSFY